MPLGIAVTSRVWKGGSIIGTGSRSNRWDRPWRRESFELEQKPEALHEWVAWLLDRRRLIELIPTTGQELRVHVRFRDEMSRAALTFVKF